MSTGNQSKANTEQGNVLFLILIAVAMFAALSYAVTSSNRSSSNASNEASLISSSAVTHYPAQVRTMINKMIFKGLDLIELEFNKPEDLATCSNPKVCVFHPQGGGAIFGSVPPDALEAGAPTNGWTFSSIWEVVEVGSSVTTSFAGNDIMMFITGVKEGVCNKVHQKMGITSIPNIGFPDSTMTFIANNFNMDTGWAQIPGEIIIGTGATAVLSGHSEGCFQTTDGTNVFYSVLFER